MMNLSHPQAEPFPASIFTLGHSTRSWETFLSLLQEEGVANLVDVRSFPTSRKFPHFDQEILREALGRQAISYYHLKELGGRRKARLMDSPNRGWKSVGFRAYADHMATEEFRAAVDKLLAIAQTGRTAILCAEAVPWRCHRQLIADFLVGLRRVPVFHIVGAGRTEPHVLTSFAVIQEGRLSYPESSSCGKLPYP